MYDMLRWRQYAECVQFCWVTLVAQILHKKPCFKPVVAFWICDVCECHFRMRVNGDACCCFTSIIANVDIVLLKWLYGHPSTCQMRSHTTEKTQTVVFCLRHVKLSFSSSLCFFFSLSGVPRQHRGEIWKFLSEQYLLRQEVPSAKPPNNDAPYKELLKQLTSQQHAILIDLG